MTRQERLGRDLLDAVARFRGQPSHDPRRSARGMVPTALNAIALVSIARGLRSGRRGLLPLAVAYVEHRNRSSRRRKRR